MIFVLIPQNTITNVTLLYARLPLFFLFFILLSFLYNDLCFDIFEREKEIFFKDIIFVMISVYNRGEIEIEKKS